MYTISQKKMVRSNKTPLPEVVVNVVDTEIVVPKVKKTNEKKSKKQPVVELVPVVPVVVVPVVEVLLPTPVVDVEVTEVVVDTIPTKMLDFGVKLQQIITLMTATKVHFKALEKIVAKDFKINQKATSKKSKRSGNRKPSGFVRPTLISDELATFLGKEFGTEMARTSVSKEINQYVRANNLQESTNGRQINADLKLKTLLKVGDNDVLTYFNLQKFLKHHFIKTVPVDVVVEVLETSSN